MTDVVVVQPDHEVLIVGGGFSGIGVAIALDRAGFGDYLLIEDGDGFGGAWHWNNYPGVGVDIPSFCYQFSFDQRSDWSRVYAPGTELKAYADDCVRKYGIVERTRLRTRVADARFDDTTDLWTVRTTAGDEVTARFLVSATGALSQPKRPNISGLDDFAGDLMHTARWDHDVELTGRRVAVIGTGASAVQAVPEIAPVSDHLTVFQRTPIWCFPKPDMAIPAAAQAVLRWLPGARRIARTLSQAFVEISIPLPIHFDGVAPMGRLGEWISRAYMRRTVEDRRTRAKLTPQYRLGCKRPTFSGGYLRTFNRDDVTLETAPIAAVEPAGVRTVDGVLHECDVLVLATGFAFFDPGSVPPFTVHGSRDTDLAQWWVENRLQAFHGVSVPGFPNFFSVVGPYAYNGSSYFSLIEAQAHHIVRVVSRARAMAMTRAEVTERANADYFASMLRRRRNQVYFRGGCGAANSFYYDEHGDVPFRPSTTPEMVWASKRFDLDAYSFTSARARP